VHDFTTAVAKRDKTKNAHASDMTVIQVKESIATSIISTKDKVMRP